jgi:hypothetical protein
MSIPKPIIEWVASSYLEDHKDIQLMLLKGHLILDALLSEVVQDKNLSFYGKVHKFKNIKGLDDISRLLLELNFIRNRLAHELTFDVVDSGLYSWSENVLNIIHYDVKFRKTKRQMIKHAIAALSGVVYQHKHSIKK